MSAALASGPQVLLTRGPPPESCAEAGSGLSSTEQALDVPNFDKAVLVGNPLGGAHTSPISVKSSTAGGQTLQHAEKVTSRTLSVDIEEQWEEFKAKFDKLNKLAFEKLTGVMGVRDTSGLRPADMISEERVAQVLRRASRLVVLTGAGISAESGIPTFRGADGFWTVGSTNYQPQELATWQKFDEMPEELWKWYQYRWGICRSAAPNAGHRALVEMESLVDGGLALVTQNIDGLHLEAGSSSANLCEIHGNLDEMRCDERVEGSCAHGLDLNQDKNLAKARATIVRTPKPAKKEEDERLYHCKVCGVRQRPKILWFDESYNEAFYKWNTVTSQMEDCDVLLIIGTQLTTGGPSRMVRMAQQAGAIIIRIDPFVDLADPGSAGMLHLQGKSGDCLPRVVEHLRRLRKEPVPAKLSPPPIASLFGTLPCTLPKEGVATPPMRSSTSGKPGSALSSTAAARGSSNPAARRSSLAGSLPRTPPKDTVAAPSTRSSTSGKPGSPLSPTAAARASSKSAAPRSSMSGGAASSPSTGSSKAALKAAASISLGKASKSHLSSAASPAVFSAKSVSAPSVVGAASSLSSTAPVGFFVYGTLRPDDDSGALWTKTFCEGLKSEPALLRRASLYVDGAYPAVSFEDTQCTVRGMLLTAEGSGAAEMLTLKLKDADQIESFPDLYLRTVAAVETLDGNLHQAHVYHRTGRTDRSVCQCIADGDWLSRRRKTLVP